MPSAWPVSPRGGRVSDRPLPFGARGLDPAEAIFSERCTGVIWELDTTRIFCLWSLFYLGRVAELGIRCHDIFHEARERGDRYMVATPGPFVGTFVRLAEDDVESARRSAPRVSGKLVASRLSHPASQFLLWLSLYRAVRRRCGRRLGRITETEPLLQSSLLLRIQQVQADVIQHTGLRSGHGGDFGRSKRRFFASR